VPAIHFFFPFSRNFQDFTIFPNKFRRTYRSVRKPEAKYGVSHFWLCGGQGGVVTLACVSATLP
jgi:hypothetical protein